MKKIVLTIVTAAILAWFVYPLIQPPSAPEKSFTYHDGDKIIERAYQDRRNNVQVKGEGVVIRLLADDTKGRRHQKFLLRLSSGHTLLVAHNIDVASRVNRLHEGDRLAFYGEYEYNAKGGVIHWTHHDPQGRHIDGWIKHGGVTYR